VQTSADKWWVKVLGGVDCFEAMISHKKKAGPDVCCHQSRPRYESFVRSDTLDNNGWRHTASGAHSD